MPASSTTRRSWISPQEPRVSGRLSAETSSPVSRRSVSVPALQRAHHLRELDLGVAALALEAPQLALDLCELLVHRSHESLELLRTSRHLAGRALLLGTTLVVESLCERVTGLREDVAGDRLHRVAQLLAVGTGKGDRGGATEQRAGEDSDD